MTKYPKLVEGVDGCYGYRLSDSCEFCIHVIHLSGIPHCEHPVDGNTYMVDEDCVCNHFIREGTYEY